MWETNENNIKDYYRLVPNPESQDEGAIELTGGPFAGLIYKYGDFRFAKPEELDETLKVEYEFEVLHIPEEIRCGSFINQSSSVTLNCGKGNY